MRESFLTSFSHHISPNHANQTAVLVTSSDSKAANEESNDPDSKYHAQSMTVNARQCHIGLFKKR